MRKNGKFKIFVLCFSLAIYAFFILQLWQWHVDALNRVSQSSSGIRLAGVSPLDNAVLIINRLMYLAIFLTPYINLGLLVAEWPCAYLTHKTKLNNWLQSFLQFILRIVFVLAAMFICAMAYSVYYPMGFLILAFAPLVLYLLFSKLIPSLSWHSKRKITQIDNQKLFRFIRQSTTYLLLVGLVPVWALPYLQVQCNILIDDVGHFMVLLAMPALIFVSSYLNKKHLKPGIIEYQQFTRIFIAQGFIVLAACVSLEYVRMELGFNSHCVSIETSMMINGKT